MEFSLIILELASFFKKLLNQLLFKKFLNYLPLMKNKTYQEQRIVQLIFLFCFFFLFEAPLNKNASYFQDDLTREKGKTVNQYLPTYFKGIKSIFCRHFEVDMNLMITPLIQIFKNGVHHILELTPSNIKVLIINVAI